jgi:RyR domain
MEFDIATVERLARRIHENYLARYAPDGPSWDDLTDDLREANRDQARDMFAKLAVIGATVEAGSGGFTFTEEELARLARAEHDRWARQRRKAGWRYAKVRDDTRKHHPMLVPWERLPDGERDKDVDAVRNIPVVLAAVGLQVVRQGPTLSDLRGR